MAYNVWPFNHMSTVNLYRELSYKMHVAQCSTTVTSQPYLGAASEDYSSSQWLSIEQDKGESPG